MAATSLLGSPSPPAALNKSFVEATSSPPPMLSPSSDRRHRSTLRSRADALLENAKPLNSSQTNGEEDDTVLLLRGFDSMSQTLSRLSNSLKSAVEGAGDLSRSPDLSEIFHSNPDKNGDATEGSEGANAEEEDKKGKNKKKRKLDEHDPQAEKGETNTNELEKMKKARNLAISMAKKAAAVARELKSVKSNLRFMQERCNLLEEENKKLRENELRDEDDLVRLQLEALLAEKSRLGNENESLKRDNQCLHQLVEYHQLTKQDLSASYENLLRGMCLDLDDEEEEEETADDADGGKIKSDFMGFSKSLDECFDDQGDDDDDGKEEE